MNVETLPVISTDVKNLTYHVYGYGIPPLRIVVQVGNGPGLAIKFIDVVNAKQRTEVCLFKRLLLTEETLFLGMICNLCHVVIQ